MLDLSLEPPRMSDEENRAATTTYERDAGKRRVLTCRRRWEARLEDRHDDDDVSDRVRDSLTYLRALLACFLALFGGHERRNIECLLTKENRPGADILGTYKVSSLPLPLLTNTSGYVCVCVYELKIHYSHYFTVRYHAPAIFAVRSRGFILSAREVRDLARCTFPCEVEPNDVIFSCYSCRTFAKFIMVWYYQGIDKH